MRLSEASKMLRRLEKGLNSAKIKSQTVEASVSNSGQDYNASRATEGPYHTTGSHFNSKELPPLNLPHYVATEGYAQSSASRSITMDDDDDAERNEEAIFPEGLIRRENQRNSFFRTILNPEADASSPPQAQVKGPLTPPSTRIAPIPTGLDDPITAGIITEEDAKVLFDAIFLRLNPFINLFDPALHTVAYVRSKCPFLFTTLIMAGCKFFRHEAYKQCQKLANDFAVRAFAEGWKRVEVVQAFACLTYWKEPDENACRMAVELKLNQYRAHPPPHETPLQLLERRNCERTYLVLFVHDRSLATQTGRHWMLPEDDMIRHSSKWHEGGGGPIRAEDVIVVAFVALRIIAAETTEIFKDAAAHDINYEAVLRTCNQKLTEWAETWQREMDREQFVPIIVLVAIWTGFYHGYLLRSSAIHSQLNESTAKEIYDLISATAEAYHNASVTAPESATATHARFLRSLVANDVFVRRKDQKQDIAIDPQLQPPPQSVHAPAPQAYYGSAPPVNEPVFPASPTMPPHPTHSQPSPPIQHYPVAPTINNNAPMAGPLNYAYSNNIPQMAQYTSELDAHYWKNMFIELGFGENEDPSHQNMVPQLQDRGVAAHGHYMENNQHMQQAHHHVHHGHPSYQQHIHQPMQNGDYGR
ncbi:hypothetical protein H0H93_012884 [Arthromyces matolae]|nr:hypothetical protein H0H93_012884 [Arthromyces matolae]